VTPSVVAQKYTNMDPSKQIAMSTMLLRFITVRSAAALVERARSITAGAPHVHAAAAQWYLIVHLRGRLRPLPVHQFGSITCEGGYSRVAAWRWPQMFRLARRPPSALGAPVPDRQFWWQASWQLFRLTGRVKLSNWIGQGWDKLRGVADCRVKVRWKAKRLSTHRQRGLPAKRVSLICSRPLLSFLSGPKGTSRAPLSRAATSWHLFLGALQLAKWMVMILTLTLEQWGWSYSQVQARLPPISRIMWTCRPANNLLDKRIVCLLKRCQLEIEVRKVATVGYGHPCWT